MNQTAPILVTGADGMLGAALRWRFDRPGGPGRSVVWTDLGELDITDRAAVDAFVARCRPGVILNCAAYTNVDGCETHRDHAMRVNAEAVGHLARAAAAVDALIVQISTDFVFPGDATVDPVPPGAQPLTEDAPVDPASVYGRSKLAGERAAAQAPEHLIVRTSWLYGPGGKNFPQTMRRLALDGVSPAVVADQVGCPTYTRDLAEALVRLMAAGARGLVHAGGAEAITWADFAREVFRRVATDAAVTDTTSQAYFDGQRAKGRVVAPRPPYSAMDCSRLERLTGYRLPGVQPSLQDYLVILAAEQEQA